MGNEKNRDDNWVHISKCGGIPMYHNEYHFEMEDPVEVTEEHVKSRKIRLAKFLEKYGLELVDEEYGCIGKD